MNDTSAYRRRSVLAAAAAGVLAGCVGDGSGGSDSDSDGDTPEDTSGDADAAAEVAVGAEGLQFDPDSLAVDPGATVEFVWQEGGHNIAVRESPDGADWDGVADVQEAGFTHSHTFDVEGRYGYVCEPHEDAGMSGEILVGDAESAGGDGGDGGDDDYGY